MKDYIKYLLSTLIVLWLLGFWYMVETGQGSTNIVTSRNSNLLDVKMKSRNNDGDSAAGEADGGGGGLLGSLDGGDAEIDLVWGSDAKQQLKMLNRIKRIEKELQQLDLRNKENDFIIKNLKLDIWRLF